MELILNESHEESLTEIHLETEKLIEELSEVLLNEKLGLSKPASKELVLKLLHKMDYMKIRLVDETLKK
jgi:hypothetical protein